MTFNRYFDITMEACDSVVYLTDLYVTINENLWVDRQEWREKLKNPEFCNYELRKNVYTL